MKKLMPLLVLSAGIASVLSCGVVLACGIQQPAVGFMIGFVVGAALIRIILSLASNIGR